MTHNLLLPAEMRAHFNALDFPGWRKEAWKEGQGDENRDLARPFLIAARLVQSAASAWAAGRMREFDPIVGENSCHVRAAALLQFRGDVAIGEELTELRTRAVGVEGVLRSFLRHPKRHLRAGAMRRDDVALEVTDERVALLVLMHFLTIGKTFVVNEAGREVSSLRRETMRIRLRVSPRMEGLIAEMIPTAKMELARLTVAFIQREAARLFPAPDALPRRMLGGEHIVTVDGLLSSCAPFNFDVVLEGLMRAGTLVLVKENQEGGERQFFRRFEAIEAAAVDPSESAFVIEGFLPGGRSGLLEQIEAVGGLREAVLINVTHLPVFGVEGMDEQLSDPEALALVAERRRVADEVGCRLVLDWGQRRTFFTISHTFAARGIL